MKLNLKYVEPIVQQNITPPTPKLSPIGWWQVTTEGDCEGWSVKQLGTYYGHLAEIAFHLADKAYYCLTFWPKIGPIVEERPEYTCSSTEVWISFAGDVPNSLSQNNGESLTNAVRKFLDCSEQVVVATTDGVAHYFKSCFLRFVPEDQA